MRVAPRLRRLWASVRPRTRRGALLAAGLITAGAAAIALAVFALAAMAWSPYLDYAMHPDVNARQWAIRDPSFASSSICARCHGAQVGDLAMGPHEEIGCQSCHGPLLMHSTATDEASRPAVAIPADSICLRCHARTEGRPAGFAQITTSLHYVLACLQCHDPHTSIAARPPVVMHPLDGLPPCLTCHGPEGFKARNVRHPSGELTDLECLDCHGPRRGPEEGPDLP